MAQTAKSDDRVQLSDHAFDLFTGSEQDKREILQLHRDYLDANTNNLDAALLRRTWSENPSCVWFNGTGYVYYGIDDWLKLWDYFRSRIKIVVPWSSQEVRLIGGGGDTAVVTCNRTGTGQWIGTEDKPPMVDEPCSRTAPRPSGESTAGGSACIFTFQLPVKARASAKARTGRQTSRLSMDPTTLSAIELLEAYRSKQLSPLEATEAVLAPSRRTTRHSTPM